MTKAVGAFVESKRLPILAANESMTIDGKVVLWWENAASWRNAAADGVGHKYIPIAITMYSWDTRGMRHETVYKLLAWSPREDMGRNEVAPGVSWSSRTTTTRPVWLLKMQGRAINTGRKVAQSWKTLRGKVKKG